MLGVRASTCEFGRTPILLTYLPTPTVPHCWPGWALRPADLLLPDSGPLEPTRGLYYNSVFWKVSQPLPLPS